MAGAAPGARAARVHVTVPDAWPQLQPDPDAETNATPAGSVSVTLSDESGARAGVRDSEGVGERAVRVHGIGGVALREGQVGDRAHRGAGAVGVVSRALDRPRPRRRTRCS
jgi:hypothetical protein